MTTERDYSDDPEDDRPTGDAHPILDEEPEAELPATMPHVRTDDVGEQAR